MKKFLSVFICFIALFCTGCSLFKTDKALITVDGEEITQKDFDSLYKRQNTSNIDPEKNRGLYLILKHNVISELIIKKLIEKEIKNHKIQVSDTEINKALLDAYAQMGGKEKLSKFLQNVYGISDEEFKKTLKEEIAINKLIDKVAPVTGTTDSEAKSFYEKNKMQLFNQPRKVRASHILIMANEDDIVKNIIKDNKNISEVEISKKTNQKIAELKAKAENILAQAIKVPADFEKLAKKYSEDFKTAQQGGDLGFFSFQEMTRPFAQNAFETKPSMVCNKIVKTDYGFHIIKVTDRKEAGILPFEEIKEEIKAKLTNDKRNKAFQAYITSKQAKATIKYKDSSYDPKNIEAELKEVAKSYTKKETEETKK